MFHTASVATGGGEEAAPSRNSVRDTAIQLVSPVLGSLETVVGAVLGLEALAAVVVVVAAAGFNAGFAIGFAAGSPVAGPVPE